MLCTRYCNYSLDKFGNEITVIKPCFCNEESTIYKEWKMAMADSEIHYFELIKLGAKPQEARDALPTSVKAGGSVTIPVINFNDMPLAHIVAYINGVEVKRVNQSESLIIENVNGDIVIRNEA